MDREQLLKDLLTADPKPGDLVYVERRGDAYRWERADGGDPLGHSAHADAWIFYSWQRPAGDADEGRAMLDDLLAEMESMTGCVGDRCRWPLDEPWPLQH